MLAALDKTKGMVYLAAKSINCAPSTIYRRAEEDPRVREAIETAEGEVLDVAETKLYQAILNGEAWAICFKLKTRGKDRGYVEHQRSEVTGANGGPIEVESRQVFDHSAAVAALAARSVGYHPTSSEIQDRGDGEAVG